MSRLLMSDGTSRRNHLIQRSPTRRPALKRRPIGSVLRTQNSVRPQDDSHRPGFQSGVCLIQSLEEPLAYTIDLNGKVALVTGAGHGIGASIARRLAEAGAKTVVNYRQSADKANAVVDSIRSAGGEAIAIQADVTERSD